MKTPEEYVESLRRIEIMRKYDLEERRSLVEKITGIKNTD